MNSSLLYFAGMLAITAPFLAIIAIPACSLLLRLPRRGHPAARRSLSPLRTCGLALAMGMQFLQVLYGPGASNVVEAQQEIDADEDEDGEPESPAKHLHRQLRRIRRGDSIERLIVKL